MFKFISYLPEVTSLFIFISGFIIALGAVTVIDIHGFLGRNSNYWTLATTRTHKVTKPLIWLGLCLCMIGGFLFYSNYNFEKILYFHIISIPLMIINGLFLSFVVSPFLLKQEKEGAGDKILPKELQNKIIVSFIFSFITWWGNLLVMIIYLINKI